MSDLKTALEEYRNQTAKGLLEILRDTPIPEEGIDGDVFAIVIRLFLATNIDKAEFAAHMGVSQNTIDRWAQGNPPTRLGQAGVIKWIKQHLLNQHLSS